MRVNGPQSFHLFDSETSHDVLSLLLVENNYLRHNPIEYSMLSYNLRKSGTFILKVYCLTLAILDE